MAPMRKWYFVGQWQVFLGGRHQFNVACREKEVLPEVPEVPWRTSVTPLEFVFLPKDGKKEMPAWSSAQRGSRKVIEHWGRPFRGFTSVVDGSAYLATTHRLPARKKAPDLISWYPCTGDTEEICEWRRHDGVSPQALNVKRKVAEISGSKKGGKRSTGSQKKAPASVDCEYNERIEENGAEEAEQPRLFVGMILMLIFRPDRKGKGLCSPYNVASSPGTASTSVSTPGIRRGRRATANGLLDGESDSARGAQGSLTRGQRSLWQPSLLELK
ncbi:unnamed protein product, partial [Polarella glacialis]